jgi:uncharacterized protein
MKGMGVMRWCVLGLMVVMAGLGCGLELKGEDAAASQPAARMESWVEREVRFKSADGVELVGTVVAPEKEASGFVLLIQGSGPTDRDGNQLPRLRTDLLKGLAHALGEAGVGSLRVDSRACASMRGSWPKEKEEVAGFFTLSKMLGDVEAAWAFMGELPEAKGKKRVVQGHSQGGVLALALEGVLKPDGMVLMATPGRTMDVVLEEQLRNALVRQGADVKTREAFMRENQRLMIEVKTHGKVTNVPVGLAAIYNPSSVLFLQEFARLNPAELALGAGAPALVVQGLADKQVSAVNDAPALVTALDKRVGGVCSTAFIRDGSHNFKRVKGDEDGLSGEVMPEVREAVVKWVVGRLVK